MGSVTAFPVCYALPAAGLIVQNSTAAIAESPPTAQEMSFLLQVGS
jgi:hypothetical protein